MTTAADRPAQPGALLGIVGPTASGKTELAVAISRHLPVEVLVADSRQAYRGMDVGTASPDAAARAAVPHHLLDLVDPDEPFTVADWVRRARPLVGEIAARGRLPMLVGGTGLYVSALVDGHDYSGQAWSPERRAVLAEELHGNGLAPLVERLRHLAPEVAARTDLRNPRRVLRALERIEAGDRETPRAVPFAGPVALVALERPRDVLYLRIEERARRLFVADGLLDEVRELLRAGHGSELRPMSGHGYHEAITHLNGEIGLEEAIERTARRTRQYAKRQLTWFRRDPRVRWLVAGDRPADDPALVDEAVARLRAVLD
ncbi:MAG: tRNA (adenosine(37)-N6)-dimethylallyltransferase MiaA [Chloroflexi bacterium]|nr:tRNA (adenosine(37)-N6)-dimethylallyltransferase MiaA [Chloroflexota bacterium]